MKKLNLINGIRYVLRQNDQGLKMPELYESLCHMREEGVLTESCSVNNIIDDIDESEDITWVQYGDNRYFVFFIK